MKHLRMAAAAAMALAISVTSGIAASNNYGALAYSTSRGIDGYSFNFKTQSAARSMAMKQCSARASGCRIVATFSRGCAALAVGRAGWGVGTATRRPEARSKAVAACRKFGKGCRIQRVVCS